MFIVLLWTMHFFCDFAVSFLMVCFLVKTMITETTGIIVSFLKMNQYFSQITVENEDL